MSSSPRRFIPIVMPLFTMLGSMALVPAVRPLLAARGAGEGAMHAFMSVNMLGAAVGAPLVSWAADRHKAHRAIAIALALADAAILFACASPVPIPVLMALRTVQGATNVGLLSILMAMVGRGDPGPDAGESQLGAAGAAMTGAIALGPAFGGVLLGLSPTAPLAAAAGLNLLVAVLLTTMPPFLAARAASPSRAEVLTRSPLLVVPLALGFAERFTVGCFVVSFAVYAHESLGLGDRETSLRMSLFVMPFAAAMYPAWLLCGRIARATLMGAGAFVYGVSFLLLALTRGALLDASLVLAGVSSALMYAPSIWYTSALAPDRSRATAMALFNAAGCLGMMLGPAVAGVLSATMRAHGHAAATRYPVIFAVAGAVQLVTLLALARPLARLRATEPRPSSALEVSP